VFPQVFGGEGAKFSAMIKYHHVKGCDKRELVGKIRKQRADHALADIPGINVSPNFGG